jgi:hypothetical protein
MIASLFRTRRDAGRSRTRTAVARSTPSAFVEPLEGRQLMAAQVSGLELWTAGKTVDTKQIDVKSDSTTTYDVAAAGHTDRLDLVVKATGATATTSLKFEVYSPVFKADASTRISQGTENGPPYVIGGNDKADLFGRLRGPKYGPTKEAAPYTLLALDGATAKRFVVRVQPAGQKKFTEFVFSITNGEATSTDKPALSSVKMVNATGAALVGNGAIKLDNTTVLRGVLNRNFTLVVAGTNTASARLDLQTDGVAGFRQEKFKPFSLYGENPNGSFVVNSVKKAGVYTLFADLYSGKGFTGTVIHEAITFRVLS